VAKKNKKNMEIVLIGSLNEPEFCSSYVEIQKFKKWLAYGQQVETQISRNNLVQHVAVSADHDICTLDGNGTFYGLAIIAATTLSSTKILSFPRLEVARADITLCAIIP